MKTRFVSADRDQPLLLPPDLRDWIPQDDLVHFVIQAVEDMNLRSFRVNVKGSGSAHVTQCASDKNELVPAVEGIPKSVGQPETVLADNGYLCEEQVRHLEGDEEKPKMNVLVSAHAEAKQLRRRHDFRPQPTEEKKAPEIRSAFVREMKEKMERDESRAKYRLRKQTVEPVFGTIKQWMGFRQFLLQRCFATKK